MFVQVLFEISSVTIPGLLVFVCIRLFRRSGGIPAVLLLIGSSAFLIDRILTICVGMVLLPYVVTHPHDRVARILWPTCTQHPGFIWAHDILTGLGWVSLYIGFVWFCIRFTRHT